MPWVGASRAPTYGLIVTRADEMARSADELDSVPATSTIWSVAGLPEAGVTLIPAVRSDSSM